MRYKVFNLIGKIFSISRIKYMRNNLIRHYNNKPSEECFTSDYPEYQLKRIWLLSHKEYKFENKTYVGLEEADAFLRQLYGDYMKLPAVEERRVHSKYKVDFGPYS